MKTYLSICALFVLSFALPVAEAQIFTPITGDYNCAQFPDGAQYLTKVNDSGYALVDSKQVLKAVNAQKKVLNGRLKVLEQALKNFKASRIAKFKLLNIANKTVLKLFGDGTEIPKELPPDEAEAATENVRQRVLLAIQTQQTIVDLINNCESGINPKTKGSVIGVSVEAISLASSNTIYGGFVMYSSKLKKSGYNVCIKLIFPDGSTGSFYSGFGDDFLCGTGTSKFEGIPQSECNKVLPAGQVGFVIQKRTYAFTSLPGQTTEQLLDQMRVEVESDRPLVGVLQFPFNLSRDASLKACEAF